MAEKEAKEKAEIKLSLKVLSDIWLTDGDFEIRSGEIKELPADYEKRPGIMNWIKSGRLKILNELKGEGKSRETLDAKDVSNFLDQNTRTVIKQLRINELSKEDLSKLLIAEEKNKRRKNILMVIRTLLEVS